MGAHKLVNCRSKSHGNYPDRSETEIKLIIEFKGNLYPILRKKVISILIYLFIFCFDFLSQKRVFTLFVTFLIKTNRAPFRIQPGFTSLKIQISKFKSPNSSSLTKRDTLKTFNKFWRFSPFFNLFTPLMHKFYLNIFSNHLNYTASDLVSWDI